MTVKSGRVNRIVVGDDVVVKHQIMQPVAYNAGVSLTPLLVTSADRVNFFYQLADSTIDLIGYVGVPDGSYPASTFEVTIAGDIPASGTTPARGTQTFLTGEAQTVRVEVLKNYGLTNQTRETYYLYDEVDVLERGFPTLPISTCENVLP